jgi:hypothetical protein
MAGSEEDRGKSRRLGAEELGWSSTGRVLDGRTIERSGDAVCGLHQAQGEEEHGFLGSASKARSMVSPILASKLVATVLVVWHKTTRSGFPVWASKPATTVW